MIRAHFRLGRQCTVAAVVLGWLSPLVGVAFAQSAASTSPAASTSTSPADSVAEQSLEAQVQDVLQNVPNLTPAQTIDKLMVLVQGDASKVTASVRAAGFRAMALAYERVAQDARGDRLNPAAERKAQEYIDAAVQLYVRAGQIALAGFDYEAAEKDFSRALSYRPNNESGLLLMARVHSGKGSPLRAIECYQNYFNATKRGAYEPEIYMEVARVYATANLWNQARRQLDAAIKNNGDTDEVAALYSETFLGLGELDRAIEQIQRAISKNPTQPAYYRTYARLLLMRHRPDDACQQSAAGIVEGRKRLDTDPDSILVLTVMNDCYDTYVKALTAVLAENQDDVKARLLMVDVLEQQADVNRLLGLHKALQAIKLSPQNIREQPAFLEKQVLLQKAVQHRELRLTCEQLLRVDPGNAVATKVLAELGAGDKAASQPVGR